MSCILCRRKNPSIPTNSHVKVIITNFQYQIHKAGKTKLLLVKKQVAYCILAAHIVLEFKLKSIFSHKWPRNNS